MSTFYLVTSSMKLSRLHTQLQAFPDLLEYSHFENVCEWISQSYFTVVLLDRLKCGCYIRMSVLFRGLGDIIGLFNICPGMIFKPASSRGR